MREARQSRSAGIPAIIWVVWASCATLATVLVCRLTLQHYALATAASLSQAQVYDTLWRGVVTCYYCSLPALLAWLPLRLGRRRALQPRRAAIVLTAAPLLALLALALVTLGMPQRQVHTGDALLDAYLQALVDRDLVTKPDAQWLTGAWTADGSASYRNDLPEAVWAGLEQRFGGSADFWLLCYACRMHNSQYRSPAAGVVLWKNVAYLEQARERGVADWRVYYWLARRYSEAWAEEAASALDVPPPAQNSPLRENVAYARQCSAWIEQHHGPARREVLSALAQSGAQEAPAQYELAYYAFARGADDAARRFMRAGNLAARNVFPHTPEVAALLRAAAQGRPLGGDRLLTGLLMLDYVGVDYWDMRPRRHMVQHLWRQAVVASDGAALTELQRYCTRKGSAAGSDVHASLYAVSTLVRLQAAYAKAHPHLSAEQARRDAALKAELAGFKSRLRSTGIDFAGALPAEPQWPQQLWDKLCTVSGGGREKPRAWLEQFCDQLLAQQAGLPGVQRELSACATPGPWEE